VTTDAVTDALVGRELLGYVVEELVGRGGMGVVYRAFDPRLKRPVAVKVLAGELAGNRRFRERFLVETELAASLEHPNVVPIHDAGDVDGRLYLVMRLVEGGDLRMLLDREGVLEPARALDVCRQLADALGAAHERGLVHRDVKPSNVLVDERGHCYLTDFGVSVAIDARSNVTGSGSLEGTVAYIAPEQIAGRAPDGRADLYSLACVLHECLTGRPPFESASDLDVLYAHLERAPPRASGLRSTLPDRLDAVLQRGLAKEPDARYDTCRAFVDAAQAAVAGDTPVETRTSTRRRRIAVGGLLGALAVAAAFGLARDDTPPPTGAAASGDGALVGVDARRLRVSGSVEYGRDLSGLVFDGESLWVASLGTGTIGRIDPGTRELREELSVAGAGSGPTGVAASGDNVWLVSAGMDSVTVYSRAQRRVRWDEPRHVFGATQWTGLPSERQLDLAAVAAGERLWTVSLVPDRLIRFERGQIETLEVRLGPGRPTADASLALGAGAVWATSGSTVLKLDPRSGEILERRSLGSLVVPSGAAATADAVWIADAAGDTVLRLDSETLDLVARIPVAGVPSGLAAGNGAIWVITALGGELVRVDPASNRVTGRVAVGPSPDDVVVADGTVWVTRDP
jgi:serine/threonine-protein kinase